MRSRRQCGESRLIDALAVAAAVTVVGVVATLPKPEPVPLYPTFAFNASVAKCGAAAGGAERCERRTAGEDAHR